MFAGPGVIFQNVLITYFSVLFILLFSCAGFSHRLPVFACSSVCVSGCFFIGNSKLVVDVKVSVNDRS